MRCPGFSQNLGANSSNEIAHIEARQNFLEKIGLIEPFKTWIQAQGPRVTFSEYFALKKYFVEFGLCFSE